MLWLEKLDVRAPGWLVAGPAALGVVFMVLGVYLWLRMPDNVLVPRSYRGEPGYFAYLRSRRRKHGG